MMPPRDDRVPYAKFHAITSKWKERALRAEDELRRRDAADKAARRPLISGGLARRVVVVELPKRDAETERNGFTTPGESGGITSEDPVDGPV
jgi:hypothetical protein